LIWRTELPIPLVSQQDVVTVVAIGGGASQAIALLKKSLEDYPPVRIIAITMKDNLNPLGRGSLGTVLVAVVESV
jgi:hypothetical protein